MFCLLFKNRKEKVLLFSCFIQPDQDIRKVLLQDLIIDPDIGHFFGFIFLSNFLVNFNILQINQRIDRFDNIFLGMNASISVRLIS